MTLYELNEAMQNFQFEIDEETGEVLNADELDLLTLEHDLKLKNCVWWYKNKKAEAEALKAEKMKLAARQASAEKQAEWMKNYIDMDLDGEPFKPVDDVTVSVAYRKSNVVECDNIFDVPDDYLRYKEPELDKAKIKKAFKEGIKVAGCRIVEKNNIQIK